VTPKENVQKDKQRSTKHKHEIKYRVTLTLLTIIRQIYSCKKGTSFWLPLYHHTITASLYNNFYFYQILITFNMLQIMSKVAQI